MVKHIKVAHWGYQHLLYLPFYIALHKGLFRKQNLEIEVLYSGNDQDVYKDVLKGKVDFAISDPLFSIKNNKVTCAGIVVNRIGIWGLTHNPAIKSIKRIEDFVGLRIGSLPSPATTYALIDNLKSSNKRLLKSMKIIEAPIGSQQSLLTSNKADIVLDIEPMVSLAESLGLKPVLSLADYYQDFAFTGITHQTSLLKTNPELVKNFMIAIDKGLKLALTDKKTSLKIAQEVFKTYEPNIIMKAYARLLKAKVWPDNSEIDSKAWESARKIKN